MGDGAAPTFAELLRRHRRAAGLTQEALAERAGLSPEGIGALERGVRPRAASAETVALLADALGAGGGGARGLRGGARPPAGPGPARRGRRRPPRPTTSPASSPASSGASGSSRRSGGCSPRTRS